MSAHSSGRSRRGRLALIIGVVLVILVVVAGVTTRATESRNLKTWTDTQAMPTVVLVAPSRPDKGPVLNLPGRLEAWSRASIFARVSGYLKSWTVDIGGRVKAGQLLAEIDAPELDQQLLQARAQLATSQANAQLAATTAHRWQVMLASDSVSRQDVDQRVGDLAAKQAEVASAKANVDRLVATKGFQHLVAPFDGVVTARATDVGALINAGSGGTGPELFAVSDISRLRVYVQVPQAFAAQVREGTSASLTVPEYPKDSFSAKVVARADSINPASGATLVQLMVDNKAARLMPGAFATVQFNLPTQPDTLRLPASALLFDDKGLRVATLDGNDKVKFKTVTIARDFGDSVEIGSGLAPNDRVIDTPPDGLADDDAVKISPPPQQGDNNAPQGTNHG